MMIRYLLQWGNKISSRPGSPLAHSWHYKAGLRKQESLPSLRLGGAALLERLGQIARVRTLHEGMEGIEFISDKYKTNTFR